MQISHMLFVSDSNRNLRGGMWGGCGLPSHAQHRPQPAVNPSDAKKPSTYQESLRSSSKIQLGKLAS